MTCILNINWGLDPKYDEVLKQKGWVKKPLSVFCRIILIAIILKAALQTPFLKSYQGYTATIQFECMHYIDIPDINTHAIDINFNLCRSNFPVVMQWYFSNFIQWNLYLYIGSVLNIFLVYCLRNTRQNKKHYFRHVNILAQFIDAIVLNFELSH